MPNFYNVTQSLQRVALKTHRIQLKTTKQSEWSWKPDNRGLIISTEGCLIFTLFNTLYKLSSHYFLWINVLLSGIFFLAVLSPSSILGSLDVKYLAKLISFLAPVLRSSSRSRFVRCWRAKTDGWAASTFHSNCDGKGPTVTIIQVGSYIFGGYTDVSWSSKYYFICSAGVF